MKNLKLLIALLFVFQGYAKANIYDAVVAQDGSGNYTTVQAAINAAPNNSGVPYIIFIKNGKYREKITVASNKTFIQLIGESVANTILYYDDPATVLGTQNSASFSINGNDFSAFDITFSNTYGDGSQAVAVLINADRAVFKNCRLLANQDTLYTKGSGTPRCYFYKCYIDGNVDFIFGSSVAIFDSCIVYAKTRTSNGSSYITAPNTPSGQTYGYLFRDCFIPANTGGTIYFLGRPWNNATGGTSAYNKSVFFNSYLPNTVSPLGWSTWDAGTITSQITFAEYKSKNIDGTLADVSQRVSWSKQFTDADTVGYNLPNMFSGWLPGTVYSNLYDYKPKDIAVSNFRGVKGAASSQFDWNISWPMTGITYRLLRSSDNVSFTEIYNTTAANDTAVNFKYIDGSLPAPGQKYYYYVEASLAGFATHNTDTVLISSKQTIITSSTSVSAFAQELGTPTDAKTYTLSGVNLTGDVTVTPPINFEISNNGGTTWYTNSTPLVLTPVSGVIPNTTISVRLNAAGLGDYSGNILHTSDNAVDVNVAVSGTTSLIVEKPVTLIHWPLTLAYSNTDSAAARSASVEAATSRFKNVALSNGTTVAAVQPYSNLYGQAFNNGTAGTGLWNSSNQGNGGTLNRSYYEEFVVKPIAGQSVRVDSIISNFNFYGAAGTTSNFGFRYGCVWSKTGFTNTSSPVDSVDVISCDSSGVVTTPVTSAHKGGFTDYLLINSKSDGTGPISRFVFTLANGGVTLNSGDSLTFRFYFSCGSGSTGRYGTLKNVLAKGVVLSTTPVKLISFSGGYNNNKTTLWWKASGEVSVKDYVIESSSDGANFMAIGKLASTNTIGANQYQFVDSRLLNENTFYRLRITDISGKITYSNILKIGVPIKSFNISIYPNPADREVVITYPKVLNEARVSIKSDNGKQITFQKLQAGTTTTIIDLSRLPKGVYFVTYSSNGEAISKKLIKR
ncbi:pectinesterase family protein [Ferruginibacter lapsinanis]|uniref:pectinesterase family protein n=1 Tax=Ferruginibacter lapsinanis TaxID=563172 RepID=UPI001E348F64|nr:pectinesterase family protein [Ferruginibacter lapsinanis]UEG49500.1 pectinesterase family protein [Ferruginibacter lapsinanis]